MYLEGLISSYAKRIYTLFEKHENLAIFEIKTMAGFTKESNSKFEAAMCELQMGMFITINGTQQKVSSKGDLYGWPATAYSTVEKWAGEELISKAQRINPQDAIDEILDRINQFSPHPELKKARRFAGL